MKIINKLFNALTDIFNNCMPTPPPEIVFTKRVPREKLPTAKRRRKDYVITTRVHTPPNKKVKESQPIVHQSQTTDTNDATNLLTTMMILDAYREPTKSEDTSHSRDEKTSVSDSWTGDSESSSNSSDSWSSSSDSSSSSWGD